MMAPPLHSFLNDLFTAHQQQCTSSHDLRVHWSDHATGILDRYCRDEEKLRSTIHNGKRAIMINQQIVNIIQDNACIHATALPGTSKRTMQVEDDDDNCCATDELDMSTSERRWFNDASSEQACAHMRSTRDTSLAKKPRIPRRRSSVDANSVAAAAAAAAAAIIEEETEEEADVDIDAAIIDDNDIGSNTMTVTCASRRDRIASCPRRRASIEGHSTPAAAAMRVVAASSAALACSLLSWDEGEEEDEDEPGDSRAAVPVMRSRRSSCPEKNC